MPSLAELRAARAAARADLLTALRDAGPAWQRRPAGGSGEDAWSPRQAAEHVVGTVPLFARAVCRATFRPPPESDLDSRNLQLPTAGDALFALGRVTEYDDAALRGLTSDDLARPHERFATVAGLIETATHHLREHAAQIRAASA